MVSDPLEISGETAGQAVIGATVAAVLALFVERNCYNSDLFVE